MPTVLTSGGIAYCDTGTATASEHSPMIIKEEYDSVCISDLWKIFNCTCVLS